MTAFDVAALDHEPVDDAVEGDPDVRPCLDVLEEGIRGQGRIDWIELDEHRSRAVPPLASCRRRSC